MFMKRAQQIKWCNDAWKDVLLYKVIHLYISVTESFEIPYQYARTILNILMTVYDQPS